jgi:hypothetical protein
MNFDNIETGNEPIHPHHYQAAHPTFPMQDKFGQVAVSFGLSKLEWAATMLAVGWWSKTELRRDTTAEEAVNMAAAILNECEKRESDLKPANTILNGI